MRISTKGRYGLASMILMAQNYDSGELTTILNISEKLGISKIYLEQVFALLKRAELVNSIKGAQGGYQLAQAPSGITAADILNAVELSLFEKTENSVSEKNEAIDKAMHSMVWDRLDNTVIDSLSKISLKEIAYEAEKQRSNSDIMFYI